MQRAIHTTSYASESVIDRIDASLERIGNISMLLQ